MAKQLNVNLAFTADTSAVLKNLQELKQNLAAISSIDINTGISTELKTAVASAQSLQTYLSNAFNTKTGNLDLSKLDASLKRSGASLSTLSNNLLGAGITGEKAFLQIQSSIASANTQLIKSNGLIVNFMTTLKNTARWQISSSVLHGFMGAVQSAYGYAQDLNESLNNIRIVTGANVEEMSRFAAEANKTAKVLSTTTTKYTNASLIYFQQGLNEEEVKQRTDITVKMANAAGASVEEVSNQLTAVWNNFAKNGENLEHYADVMTALGAATASSTDEIAGGLEKFAAVADTIGLSFDYAASALATITSNTRQSEEVVGTALKTIFARIQGLNLGETLDDGTTLNKYSEALQKVGISIFEQNGEIKRMDDILDEMAAKWGTLAKDQQIALAQTVAGVRQYTQLVSLMDNWASGDSDSMMVNLQTSANAEGSLQKQSDIYSESWEAASERVRTALESIYKELVPDDIFIGLLKELEKVLNMVEALINAFGGLEGILMLVSSVVLTKFTANIGQGIQTGIDKVKNLSITFKELGSYVKNSVSVAGQGIAGATQATFQSKQKEDGGTYKNTGGFEKITQAAAQAQTSVRGVTIELERQQALSLNQASQTERTTKAFQSQVQTLKETTALTKTVKENSKLFTEDTSKQLLNEIEQVRVLGEKKALLIEQSEILKEQNRNLMDDVAEDLYADSPEASGFTLQGDAAQGQVSDILKENIKSLAQISGLSNGLVVGINRATGEMKLFNTETKQANDDFSNLESLVTTSVSQITQVSSITTQLKDINLDDTFATAADKAAAMQEVLNKTTGISESLRSKLQSAIDALKSGNTKQFNTILSRTGVEAKNIAKALGVSENAIKRATQAGQKQASNIKEQTNAQNAYNNALNQTNQNIQTALANAAKIGPVIAQGLSSFQSVAMGISSVSNAITTLTDSSASFTSKFTATAMGLTMGFRSFMIVIQGVNSVLTAMNGTQAIANALAEAQVVLTGQMTAAKAKETIGTIAQLAAEEGLNTAQVASMLTEKLGIGTKKAAALARLLVTGAANIEASALAGATAAQAADTVVTNAGTAANIAYAASQWLVYWPLLLIVTVIAAVVAVTVALVNARKAEIEANKELAESAQKTADATKEEADANKELLDSYTSALKAYEKTGEGKQALIDAALEAAKAYNVENAAVLALTGNYKELTKALQKKRQMELQGQKRDNDTAITATNKAFSDALREDDGYLTGSGGYYGQFDNGWDNSDEQAAYDALSQGDYQYLSRTGGEIAFNVADISDPRQMFEYYQELEAWIKAQQEIATEKGIKLGASEIYQDAMAELEAGSEYYEKLKQYMSDNENIMAEIAAYDTTIISDGAVQDIWDIDSLKEYQQFEEVFSKNYATSLGLTEADGEAWEQAIQYAQEYLGIFEHLHKFSLDNEGFEGLINEENTEEIQKIKDYYDSLNSSEQELFWSIGIDENSTLEEVQEAIENAQEWLRQNELIGTITFTKTLSDQLEKEKKTQEDWANIKTSYDAFLKENPTAMDWSSFMGLSQEEQIAYIENFCRVTLETLEYVGENSLQAATDTLVNAQEELIKAQQDLDTATQNAVTAAQDVETRVANLDATYEAEFSNNFNAWGTDINGNPNYGSSMYSMFGDDEYGYDWSKFENTLTNFTFLGEEAQGLLQTLFDASAHVIDESGYFIDNTGEYSRLISDTARALAAKMGYDPATDPEGFTNFMSSIENIFLNGQVRFNNAGADVDDYNLMMAGFEQGYQNRRNKISVEDDDEFDVQNDASGKVTAAESEVKNAQNMVDQARQNEQYFKDLIEEDISAENFDLNVYEELKKQLLEVNPALEDQQILLHNLAKQQLKAERGLKKMSDSQEDWMNTIESSKKEGSEYLETVVNIRDAYADVFDLDPSTAEKLGASFLTDAHNMDLMTQALEGNDEAWDEWKLAVANAIMTDDIKNQVSGLTNGVFDQVMQDIATFNFKAEGIEIGASVEDTAFWQALDGMQIGSNEAAQAISESLSSMGVDAKIIKHVQYADGSTQSYTASGDWFNPATGEIIPVDAEVEESRGAAAYTWYTLEGATYNGKGVSLPSGGSNKGGGGGGSSKPKKADKINKSDVVERYKEINDQLDDVADAMDDASKAADRLYGAGRIKQMQKVNDLIQDEIALTKEKKKEALAYLDEDKQALFDAAAEAGVMLDIDKSGLITNYTDAMTGLYKELDAEIAAANQDGNADENEQERIDQIQGRIDTLQGAIDQYDETRELIEDLDNELDEKFYEWQDNNAEMLNYKLELKLDFNDMELEQVEYYLNKIEDQFYHMAEAGALMVDNDGQLGIYLKELGDYEKHLNNLEESYKNNEISQDAYIEGLKEARSGIFENLEALQELDDTMMEYYGDTIAMAQDELAKYTDQMEHQSSVLEHYASILELIGKSTDYKALGIVLEGQLKAAENRAAVAKRNMEMYKEQADARYAEYQQALAAGDEAAAELYLKQYEAALQAANEAEEEYLSSVEEWGDKIRAVLENTMKGLAQTLENALTGGTSFDQLTTSLERAKSLQEEYLTTTNKIYETNKLMRTAQQAIDKSTNSVAKQKLKGFIEETQQLQNQSKLSQYELEIQQAKYDLLLAEIALQEAQDAKSMVRLQRDSEGNFGYVYTADQAAVGEAENNLLAKQNDLYNISLRGANEYTEKYQQTLNEMYDTLTDLQQQYLDGAFESEEEYNAAVEAAKAYFYQKLQDYSNLYTVAITTDNRVVADAWSTNFADMTGNTEEWMVAVGSYIDDIKVAFGEYETQMDILANESVGQDLKTLAEKTQNITKANDELLDKITNPENGVIKGIEDQLNAVANLTKKYGTLRDSLGSIKKSYEDLTEAIYTTIRAQAQIVTDPDITNTEHDADRGGGSKKTTDDLGNGNGSGDPPPQTPSDDPVPTPVPITLYADKAKGSRMGIYTVTSESKISFGKPVISEDGSNIKMVSISGPGFHGYTTLDDREAVRNSLGFDTGGYTGNWGGPYGKLAFLHQKELVLNKGDTDNFLASMEVLERILQVIDLQSASSQIGGILSAPGFNSNTSTLEQNVHIEASFPNATDHNEIEEAFGNLINLASQYANRK